MKKTLKVWNQEVFGDLSLRKSSLLSELSSLDSLDEIGKEMKMEVMGELDHLIELEEVS